MAPFSLVCYPSSLLYLYQPHLPSFSIPISSHTFFSPFPSIFLPSSNSLFLSSQPLSRSFPCPSLLPLKTPSHSLHLFIITHFHTFSPFYSFFLSILPLSSLRTPIFSSPYPPFCTHTLLPIPFSFLHSVPCFPSPYFLSTLSYTSLPIHSLS